MLTLAEKQAGLAKQAKDRGLIDQFLERKIITAKSSYDLVETLYALIMGDTDQQTTVDFIKRMIDYQK